MRKVSVRQKRRNALDLLFAFLLLALLVAILLAEITRSASAVSRERAVMTSFTVTEAYEGYLFRDEEVLLTTNNGPIEYHAFEGDAVSAGDTVANVYTDGTGRDKREQAAAIYAEIAALEKALATGDTAWQTAYLSSWSEVMGAPSAGNWRGGAESASSLADALIHRDTALTGDTGRAAIEARIAELTAAAEDLVRYEQMLPVRAATSGVFTTTVDGLESIFGKGTIADLTPEGLQQKLTTAPAGGDAIGKLIDTGECYIAIPLSGSAADTYTVGNTYRIRFTRCGAAIDMELSRISYSTDGAAALLILYTDAAPAALDPSRRQTVEIERETVTGLALPAAAVQTDGTSEVVYIEVDGKAVARAIKVLYRDAGVLILAPDAGEGYLAEGDEALVTERSLYEGRVIR